MTSRRPTGPRGWLPVVVAAMAVAQAPSPLVAQIEVSEASIAELQAAMSSGQTSALRITEAYLARIDAYDRRGPALQALVWHNANALERAREMDAERAAGRVRGPLHGIPVLLKDNYGTADMPTSGGALALAGLMRAEDAHQVRLLREAGAIILGKTNMHEMASGITTIGSLGGQTRNPYDPTRNPGGSSGGTGAAIAAGFATVGWGSDTCGSIRIPSAQNALFGLRPTKGLSSIAGIMPLSHTQDVGGPLARTVQDLAISLDATVGPDPNDPATAALAGRTLPRFTQALDPDALDGARIGVLEAYFGDATEDRPAQALVRAALERMGELGAQVVDDVEIPGLDSLISGSSVIGHEFKWDLMDYLAQTPNAPMASLTEIIESGLLHRALLGSMRNRDRGEERDSEAYRAALAKRGPLRDAVVAVMDAGDLDAIVYPTLRRPPARIGEPQRGSSCQLSASTGMPALSAPVGFTADGLPIGIEMLGRPFDDARLVAIAYAFEQATDHRQPPAFTPPLFLGNAPPPDRWAVGLMDPPPGDGQRGAIRAIVAFTLDEALQTLRFQTDVRGDPSDAIAVVLQSTDAEGRWFVIERLSGPGVVRAEGVLELDPDLRRRLSAGDLFIDLVTTDHPTGVGRRPVR